MQGIEPDVRPGGERLVDAFVGALGEYRAADVFNPWRERSFHDLHSHAPQQRMERLRMHLTLARTGAEPVVVFCGEAPGWRGCRYSGIPFTSEAQLVRGEVPRVPVLRARLTDAKLPLSEPSATTLWGVLRDCGVQEQVVLWNAFPWHPMGAHMHTNRTPTKTERTRGLELLGQFLGLFPAAVVIAVGAVAAASVREVGVLADATVRHPSFGGAPEFRAGVTGALQAAGLYRPRRLSLFAPK